MTHRFLVAVVAGLILLPSVTLAAEEALAPMFNPVCWRQKDCEAQRQKMNPGNRETSGGWVTDFPCTGEWGKCLPTGITKTQIAIGGRREFTNLGDYLQQIYRYSIMMAGILAVVVIMISGVQWLTSGGSSEKITSAKKRLGGAIMGLFLVYMSYSILTWINPALTTLRLPQAWMVRPATLMPSFCSGLPTSTTYALASDNIDDQVTKLDTTPDFANSLTYSGVPKTDKINKNWVKETFYCGKRFFMDGGGSGTCFGDVCKQSGSQPFTCSDLPYEGKAEKKKFNCVQGQLMGSIDGTVGGASNKTVDNDIKLLAFCKTGKIVSVTEIDATGNSNPQYYRFNLPADGMARVCGGEKNVGGYFLGVEGNDETAAGGALAEGGEASTGADDWYAVGQTAPGSRDCSVNLAKAAMRYYPPDDSGYGECGPGNIQCSCSYIGLDHIANNIKLHGKEFEKYLISPADLKRGYTCNIHMDRRDFPPTDNGAVMVDLIKAKEIGWAVGTYAAPAGAIIAGGTFMFVCATVDITAAAVTLGAALAAMPGCFAMTAAIAGAGWGGGAALGLVSGGVWVLGDALIHNYDKALGADKSECILDELNSPNLDNID
ncbi:MAG: pilin [Candidatus Magasanikbacteria bacterium]|nr:pilin [Candidatus Magasanikbacteria bacterium]